MARDLVLTVTFLLLIYTAAHQPPPVKSVETPYCVVTFKAARKNLAGEFEFGYAQGYGLCSLQDIYRNI